MLKITNFNPPAGGQITNKKEWGQSLVEVVVAVGLIFTAVVALLGLATISMKGSGFGLRKVQATKLANEGMEVLRAYRNNNGWGTLCNEVDDNNCHSTQCYATPTSISTLSSNDSENTDGDPFSRYFQTGEIDCSGRDLKLRVFVQWTEHGETKTVKISSQLSSWN